VSGQTTGAEPSKVERIKEASDHLRGTIAQELAEETPAFREESVQLLKFHGVYQQDDRDRRKEARAKGQPRWYQMMIRTRIPGGVVTPEGYLAHDRIAERWGNGTLRITTRQDFQLHGVLKGDLKRAIQAINRSLMTTLGGCGDQERNIMCCPAPVQERFREEVGRRIAELVAALTARTGAYHEIWLDGERLVGPDQETEPLYGERYLPRKFKTTVALEGDNCTDVYANDLGLVARRDAGGDLAGFDVLVGGSLGRTNNKPDTFPALSRPLGFVEPDRVVAVSTAVVAVQRDHGNRSDRRHARMKYLIQERGLDWFRGEVQARLGFELPPARPLRWEPVTDHLGWHERGDGRLYLGVSVENGRIADGPEGELRTALRRLLERLPTPIRLTPQQNLILADVPPDQQAFVDRVLDDHGVVPAERLHPAVRYAMACPAIPTCGLAVAESERVLPGLIRRIAAVEDELGLGGERISYRMTGCPNGCARPYLGDVGFVGTTLGKYDVFLGGDFEGTRLNELYATNVPLEEIPELLRPLLAEFGRERRPGQGFGDWCHEVGIVRLRERYQVGAA
jgi:sulfite reductase (ferredoxin)